MKKNFLSKNKRVLFCADDFGISPVANQRILDLAKKGLIDSVAVMMEGGITSEEAQELAASGVKIDLHLTIAELDPFEESKRTHPRNVIFRGILFLRKFFSGALNKGKVSEEWETQLEKFQEVFHRFPDGINSHEHVHYFPALFKVASLIAKKHQIEYLRCGEKIISPSVNRTVIILEGLRFFAYYILKKNNLKTFDYLCSYDWIKKDEELAELINKIPEGAVLEVVFHPERDREQKFLMQQR
jgi:predicted glycoside hydrolase/deacetylase ChbG (UPF0249 family)